MTTVRTVPGLFAFSQGITPTGDHLCFYCGERCGEKHAAATYVKSSFTGRDGVVAPGSTYVCAGCVLCLNEAADIRLIDGSSRSAQKTRGYSWLITNSTAVAATKAHLRQLRTACLNPPLPPFAICLSDSGQKHLLYRGVVNHGRQPVVVTLETERIAYYPSDLADRLTVCGRLIGATGKPALTESITTRFAMAVMERYRDGEDLLIQWNRVREEPMSRLATWLSAPREECRLAFPSEIEWPNGSGVDAKTETRTPAR